MILWYYDTIRLCKVLVSADLDDRQGVLRVVPYCVQYNPQLLGITYRKRGVPQVFPTSFWLWWYDTNDTIRGCKWFAAADIVRLL